MESNGFGTWKQNIVVYVEKEHVQTIATSLGVQPFKEAGEPVLAYFAWTRLTTMPRNDEDVVWDLSVALGDAGDRIDWQVDWRASDY